ncbi:MAG: ABC transporter permease [Verrucomicrobia bacterium]|nr:ABC transporter permease [Leptolyngbya sp. ES-bin-22]
MTLGVALSIEQRAWLSRLRPFAPILGAIVALVLGGVLLRLSGVNPVAAYAVMLKGAFGGMRQLTDMLLKMTPLLIIALGLTMAFRAKVWNIGAEGQYYIGALVGSLPALGFSNLPGWLLIPLMLLAGMMGGALWSGIAGLLHIKRGVNLIISTLMLNYIGILLIQYAVRVPLREKDGFLPESAAFSQNAQIPTLLSSTRLHWGVLLAVVLVGIIYVLLWRTPLGFQLRAVGSRLSVARCSGINTSRSILIALMTSGALAGLAGVIEVSCTYARLKAEISDSYGFTSILVALLGQLNPLGVLFSALLFSALMVGAQSLNVVLQIPVSLAQILQALLVLCVLTGITIAQKQD